MFQTFGQGFVYHSDTSPFLLTTLSLSFSGGFQPCPLHAEISLDSLNLLMILWFVDGEIPKFFAVLF